MREWVREWWGDACGERRGYLEANKTARTEKDGDRDSASRRTE